CLSSKAEKRPQDAGAFAEGLKSLVKSAAVPDAIPVARAVPRPLPPEVITAQEVQEEEILDALPVKEPAPRKRVARPAARKAVASAGRVIELGDGHLIARVPPQEVFLILQEVMLQCGVTNLMPNPMILTVEGKTGLDWWSFGQRVVGQVRPGSRGTIVT